MRVAEVRADPLNLELDAPFEIALGTRHEARNLLVEVETDEGVVGYGEGSPLPPVTGETQGAAVAIAREAGDLLEGRNLADYRALCSDLRAAFPGANSALFALETAVLDAYCRSRGLALSELFGGPPRPVETDLTIPIVGADEARQRASAAATAGDGAGFAHLKIKTGDEVEAAVERVVAAREGAPDAELKVDANQGWTPEETLRFVRRLGERGVELGLLEQPVHRDDLAGLARVRDRARVPVAADEAVFSPEDALAVVRADAADVLNVKLGKSGPIAAAEIAAIAEAANLELMVGCMLESALGIHASAHVVAGLGSFDYVDLDGNRLLAEDVVASGPESGPEISITGPGHGVVPERS
ncbi:dipeptide epimerase [Halorussus salinus]|uniref:dipeptide epimerase n=1 Tax=Halorussus salinus TaxID=1364935 RepID=UPI001092E0E9